MRPLFDDGTANPSAITRDYLLRLDADAGRRPLLSVFGGKITTYRRLAERALEQARAVVSRACGRPGRRCAPARRRHAGRRLRSASRSELARALSAAAAGAHARTRRASRRARRRGARRRARPWRISATHFGADLYAREVDYLVEHEWARERRGRAVAPHQGRAAPRTAAQQQRGRAYLAQRYVRATPKPVSRCLCDNFADVTLERRDPRRRPGQAHALAAAQGAAPARRAAAARARDRHRARARSPSASASSTATAASRCARRSPRPDLVIRPAGAAARHRRTRVQQAVPRSRTRRCTLVLYGDVPLLGAETLKRADRGRRASGCACSPRSSTTLPATGASCATGAAQSRGIVEEKDASPDAAPHPRSEHRHHGAADGAARGWLRGCRNDNAQREYYLTDVVKLALGRPACRSTRSRRATRSETLGVNSKRAARAARAHLPARSCATGCSSGVALADPLRLDVRGEPRLRRATCAST